MIGVTKPLTKLGKFLAKKAIDLDLSRSALAAHIGVSENLLNKLMHGRGYKLSSVKRVLFTFESEITDEMAEDFILGARGQSNRYVFECAPGTLRDLFFGKLHERSAEIEDITTDELRAIWVDIANDMEIDPGPPESTDEAPADEPIEQPEEAQEPAMQGQPDAPLWVEVTPEEAAALPQPVDDETAL